MRKTPKYAFLITAAIAIAIMAAGCVSFPGLAFAPKKGQAPHVKGEVIVVAGKAVVNGNQCTLEDQASDDVFRFVGLKKDDAAALSRLAGHVVRIRLKIISIESAKSMNAQLVDILQ